MSENDAIDTLEGTTEETSDTVKDNAEVSLNTTNEANTDSKEIVPSGGELKFDAPLPVPEEKVRAVEMARAELDKKIGKGTVMRLSESPIMEGMDVVSSGAIGLDWALGVGGYPRGRVIEMYGAESSGKTTLALHAIASAQKMGGIGAFIDVEHAMDPTYAAALGVKTDDLWISQPESGEQALDIAETMIRSGGLDVMVIDSVAALVPRAEIEGEMGDSHMGLQARLMSQALRKLISTVSKTNTVLIFINQTRMKIGVMFGNPETTTGGLALRFYTTIRLDIRKFETIDGKSDGDPIGIRVRVKVAKNKVAPPFRKTELDIYFGKGISAVNSLLDCAVKYNIVTKKGAYYYYKDELFGQGKENAVATLEERADIRNAIDAAARAVMFPKPKDVIKESAPLAITSGSATTSAPTPTKAKPKRSGKSKAKAAAKAPPPIEPSLIDAGPEEDATTIPTIPTVSL